jgi:hypothetical protein
MVERKGTFPVLSAVSGVNKQTARPGCPAPSYLYCSVLWAAAVYDSDDNRHLLDYPAKSHSLTGRTFNVVMDNKVSTPADSDSRTFCDVESCRSACVALEEWQQR